MTDDEWFGPVHGDPPEDSAFLVRLRERAPSVLDGVLSPESTAVCGYAGTLVMLDAVIAEKPYDAIDIQLRFHDRTVAGYWGGGGYLWDDYTPHDPETLVVQATSLREDELADIALDWIRRQLARPLVELQWWRRGRIVARTWKLADTGHVVERRGFHRPGRRPDRTVEVRPRP